MGASSQSDSFPPAAHVARRAASSRPAATQGAPTAPYPTLVETILIARFIPSPGGRLRFRGPTRLPSNKSRTDRKARCSIGAAPLRVTPSWCQLAESTTGKRWATRRCPGPEFGKRGCNSQRAQFLARPGAFQNDVRSFCAGVLPGGKACSGVRMLSARTAPFHFPCKASLGPVRSPCSGFLPTGHPSSPSRSR